MTTLTGATFAGVVATALMAAPAMACATTVGSAGTPTCDTTTGTWTITWSIDNTAENWKAANFTVTSQTPTDSKVAPTTGSVAKGTKDDKAIVQTGVPAGTTVATVKLAVKLGNEDDATVKNGTVNIPATTCEKVTPPPSGGGGGGTTPSASASPSPSASKTAVAAPTLPVTGSQTSLYAGGAVVLLGAGAGLYVMARRRRVKFEV